MKLYSHVYSPAFVYVWSLYLGVSSILPISEIGSMAANIHVQNVHVHANRVVSTPCRELSLRSEPKNAVSYQGKYMFLKLNYLFQAKKCEPHPSSSTHMGIVQLKCSESKFCSRHVLEIPLIILHSASSSFD